MTPEEVAHFKKQIMNQIVQSKIRIYEFPECEVIDLLTNSLYRGLLYSAQTQLRRTQAGPGRIV